MIPKFQQEGAAIGTLIAEMVLVFIQVVFAYSYIKSNINYENFVNYLVGGSLIGVVCGGFGLFSSGLIIATFLSVDMSIGIYFGFLYVLKNELVFETTNKLLPKLIKFERV